MGGVYRYRKCPRCGAVFLGILLTAEEFSTLRQKNSEEKGDSNVDNKTDERGAAAG